MSNGEKYGTYLTLEHHLGVNVGMEEWEAREWLSLALRALQACDRGEPGLRIHLSKKLVQRGCQGTLEASQLVALLHLDPFLGGEWHE